MATGAEPNDVTRARKGTGIWPIWAPSPSPHRTSPSPEPALHLAKVELDSVKGLQPRQVWGSPWIEILLLGLDFID